MLNFKIKEKYDFYDLVDILALLRGKDGCPWDKEQTNESIKKNFIEEVYEAIEGIDSHDDNVLKEELGDVLLQVVFHAEIARGECRFDIDEVTTRICKKLIFRHPHIFGRVTAETSEKVLQNWEEIKKKEKGFTTQTEVLKGISRSLPALMRSYKIQQKAAKVGFDWDSVDGAFAKLREELDEVGQAWHESSSSSHLEEEIGDLLFAVVNVARFGGIDPELALGRACDKFIKRFSYIEKHAKEQFEKPMEALSLEEMDSLWNQCKKTEKTDKTI
jgi:tetrapyrrole methylase family protein/MazG family protein